jgi:translation initiation factor IF-3
MDHKEYIQRMMKQYQNEKNHALFDKRFLGRKIRNLKLGKRISEKDIAWADEIMTVEKDKKKET